MNKVRLSQLLYVGLLLMLAACQAAGQPQKVSMFRPDDTMTGMRLTKGAIDAPSIWAFCSPVQQSGNLRTSDCNVPIVSKLAIGYPVANDRLYDLDWSQITWELSIDGQPVDLQAFGTFEYVLPRLSSKSSSVREVFKTATAWDVVLTNLVPGEHTLRGQAQTRTDSYTWIINLTIKATAVDTQK